ncbi:hypothetical protein ACLMAJ_30290 [Nocardia sp. KC 131]|uniref:hypothetical protein n=1 Tax=Nocardia arseniciresistens TaxID=3392119 RepID=UPI00398E62B8
MSAEWWAANDPGPHAASTELFDGRIRVLTPPAETRSDAIETVVEFVGSTGARPVMTAHGEHDRIVARTSHAPHLVASAPAALCPESAELTELLRRGNLGRALLTQHGGAR